MQLQGNNTTEKNVTERVAAGSEKIYNGDDGRCCKVKLEWELTDDLILIKSYQIRARGVMKESGSAKSRIEDKIQNVLNSGSNSSKISAGKSPIFNN